MSAITIRVATEPAYEVLVGRGLLREAALRTQRWPRRALLSDTRVAPLYANALGLSPAAARHVVPAGESSKSFDELARLLEFLAGAHLDRRSCLLALGGGVVGDLGGLAAALYMRGIDFVQLPTTLLAQVDSSVGGKTAVNLAAGKNLAGAFHQPALVLADTETLATLDEEQYRSGLGEVLKTAVLAGNVLLSRLEEEQERVLARDADLMAEIVAECVRTKAAIVARDPTEKGERKLLNLGHTFAHAIEHAAGYGTIPHGIAVGTGLVLALDLVAQTKILHEVSLAARVRGLLAGYGMPESLSALRRRYHVVLAPQSLIEAMRLDKKSSAGLPRFVLPQAPGVVTHDVDVDAASLAAVLAAS